ncbi:unnamed protein product [Pieris macdunnoughi]|uniref:Uncharacterized protein n=1 Tax=Pieris macdunnoughi TaxID=345717 RepID=A0A821SDD9_9NEOP|nr:unnamed protein product [Pieris macdunnoughi]
MTSRPRYNARLTPGSLYSGFVGITRGGVSGYSTQSLNRRYSGVSQVPIPLLLSGSRDIDVVMLKLCLSRPVVLFSCLFSGLSIRRELALSESSMSNQSKFRLLSPKTYLHVHVSQNTMELAAH